MVEDVITNIGLLWENIKSAGESVISSIGSKISDVIDDILGGYIYDFVINLGDKAFGFFTPDNINDFNFSNLLLFVFGIVFVSIIVKIINIFF